MDVIELENERPNPEKLEAGSIYIFEGGYYLTQFGVSRKNNSRGDKQLTAGVIFVDGEYIEQQTGEHYVMLVFATKNGYEKYTMALKKLISREGMEELISLGAPLLPKNYSNFLDFIIFQKKHVPNYALTKTIGWLNYNSELIYLLTEDKERQILVENPLFQPSISGTYEQWLAGFHQFVQGNRVQELIFVMCLYSIILGLDPLLMKLDLEPFIFHISADSGTGKTSTMIFMLSIFGNPNIGEAGSLFRSHSTTLNAATKIGGVQGVLIGMDDLSVAAENSFTQLSYRIGNGVDKQRLNTSSEQTATDSFRVVILSTGEEQLSNKLTKKGGAGVRTLELEDVQFTVNAEHAEQLKRVGSTNYGHFAPLFAQKLLTHKEDIETIITHHKAELLKKVITTDPKIERISKRFAAALYAAEIANELGCQLDLKMIKEDLIKLLEKEAVKLDYINAALGLYRNFIETNQSQFMIDYKKPRNFGKVYGSIEQISEGDSLYKVIVTKETFSEIVNQLDLPTDRTLLKAWKKAGYLYLTEKDRLYYRDGQNSNYVVMKLELNLTNTL